MEYAVCTSILTVKQIQLIHNFAHNEEFERDVTAN